MSRPAFARAAFAFYRYPLYAYGYSYKTGTTLVSSLTVSTNAASTSDVYTYTYNSLGYITNVKKNGTTITSYSYDALGQMISESNAATGEIYIYTYDKAGNITKKDIYVGDIGNLTDTITYTYGNTAWKDRLTNYDGNVITYDSMGNPTKWVGIAALTWNGRQLTYLSEDGLDHGVAFTYNADGIRTKKTFYDYDGSVTTHNYVLDGTNIIKETVTDTAFGNSYTLYYVYDCNGHVTGLHYNNQPYYFQKNMQGDILRILDKTGTAVVEYTYDAWGNILSTTGSMASTLGQYNSFRYRGYYYDSETGFYYLESRYYDPAVGRFINADVYVSTGEGIRGYNMFAYCLNNPVTRTDSSGADSFSVTTDDDDNPLDDLGSSNTGIGGGSGGGTVNNGGTGSTTTSSTISGSGSGSSTGSSGGGTVNNGGTGSTTTSSTISGSGSGSSTGLSGGVNSDTLSNAQLKTFGTAGKSRGFRVIEGTHADAVSFVETQTGGVQMFAPGKFMGTNIYGVEFRYYANYVKGYTSIRINGVPGLIGIKFIWPTR